MIRTLTRPITARNLSSINTTRILSYYSPKDEQLTYTEKQEKKGRFVSPHVTIYKFPIAAISSITNRATGAGLAVGVASVSALSLVGVDVPALLSTVGNCFLVGTAAKFVVAFPFTYHYLAGLRHLKWDKNPEILDTDYVTKSSTILFGSSLAISLGIALL